MHVCVSVLAFTTPPFAGAVSSSFSGTPPTVLLSTRRRRPGRTLMPVARAGFSFATFASASGLPFTVTPSKLTPLMRPASVPLPGESLAMTAERLSRADTFEKETSAIKAAGCASISNSMRLQPGVGLSSTTMFSNATPEMEPFVLAPIRSVSTPPY
jgi:hypothetical protein